MPFFVSRKKIQSMVNEGVRNVTSFSLDDVMRSKSQVRKNNFATYETQIKAIRDMYHAKADYGSGLVRNIVDTRVSLIAGEGISVFAKSKKTQKFIDKLLSRNKLHGSMLMSIVTGCEMEGKNLLTLQPDKKNNTVYIREFSYSANRYTVERDEKDSSKILSVKWTDSKGEDYTYPEDKIVYLKYGAIVAGYYEPTPRIANCLTQIENYERALYDLRFNNHLFGRVTPYWKTDTEQAAKAINNALNNKEWDFGQGYAGTADFKYVTPDTGASDTITKEMSLNLKIISAVTGIPVHWLAWTDLMSNRSTADELREMIMVGVKKEKLILVEGLYELIDKAMTIAVDSGLDDAVYDPDGYTLDIPVLTMEQIKSLADTWIPLYNNDIISKADIQNRIPGINPSDTNKMIDSEKSENMERFAGNINNIPGRTDEKDERE